MTHAITERAMIANLSIGIWQGYKLDREASTKVTQGASAQADAARVNKHLVSKESLKPVVTAANNVRAHFYDNTLPWRDNGDRILTRMRYMEFIQAHEALVAEFDATVSKFLDAYPQTIEQAEFRMGELFKRDDYPTVSQLRHRFYVTLDFDAVTTSNDFRVAIDQEHVDKVRAQMDSAAEKRLHNAMGDVWRRMGEALSRFHERMSQPDAVFRDSTVTNVQELIELIPGLNVVDDPNIEQVRSMIAKSFGTLDAKDIRKDPAHRQELAGEAKAVMDKMAGFIRAFGGGSE